MRRHRTARIAALLNVVGVLVGLGSAHAASDQDAPHLKLMHLLPGKVAGFVAEAPHGETVHASGRNMAEVSRVYFRGKRGAPQRVTIKITDGAESDFFTSGTDPAGEFNNETPEGVIRQLTLSGYPSIEEYDTAAQRGSLLVFVGGRFLVQIESNGLDRSSLLQWWKKLDSKKLARIR